VEPIAEIRDAFAQPLAFAPVKTGRAFADKIIAKLEAGCAPMGSRKWIIRL